MKVLAVIAAVFVLILSGSAYLITRESGADIKTELTQQEEKSCCSDEMGSDAISDNSVYLLESDWKNQEGNELNITSLKNKNIVLGLIFANCTYACPIIVNDMKKVEQSLSGKDLKDTKFVLVSIDPERDTPEKLKEFGQKMGLDFSKWDLLTGSEYDIRDLAALLGFKYKKDDTGNYSHSNMISVLDKNGEIVYQHEGLNEDISQVAKTIKSMNGSKNLAQVN